MSVDLDDEAAIRRLRDEFRGVSFGRTIGGLRPPRPNPNAVLASSCCRRRRSRLR